MDTHLQVYYQLVQHVLWFWKKEWLLETKNCKKNQLQNHWKTIKHQPIRIENENYAQSTEKSPSARFVLLGGWIQGGHFVRWEKCLISNTEFVLLWFSWSKRYVWSHAREKCENTSMGCTSSMEDIEGIVHRTERTLEMIWCKVRCWKTEGRTRFVYPRGSARGYASGTEDSANFCLGDHFYYILRFASLQDLYLGWSELMKHFFISFVGSDCASVNFPSIVVKRQLRASSMKNSILICSTRCYVPSRNTFQWID